MHDRDCACRDCLQGDPEYQPPDRRELELQTRRAYWRAVDGGGREADVRAYQALLALTAGREPR